MSDAPFTIPTPPPIYSDGVVPLENKEKDFGEYESLGTRGERAEREEIERRKKESEAAAELVVAPKRKRGRPRKEHPVQPYRDQMKPGVRPELTANHASVDINDNGIGDIRINLKLSFIREIVASQQKMFKLLEDLSSGNPRISSPTNGGIDFEHAYDLQNRLREAGLV